MVCAFGKLDSQELAKRKAGREKAARVYDLAYRAKLLLYKTMSEPDGHPICTRLGVLADAVDRCCDELADDYGVLVQVHDVTERREMVAQGTFLDSRLMEEWANEYREGIEKCELVTEDSPTFMVMVRN